MSCRVQDGAKVANDGSKRKPQTQFPSRRMSGHCDWRSSSGYLHWLSTSATPPGDRETGKRTKPWHATWRRTDGKRPKPWHATWNGGRQQKRPFPMSEFQVEAFCFHPERPNGTGSPPTATTVPGERTKRNNDTGGPPAVTTVPGGKPGRQ